MKRIGLLMLLLTVGLAGCSIEGDRVDGCTMHQDTSALAGVAFGDCPIVPGRVYIPGNAQGYVPAVAPIVEGGSVAGGLTGGAAILAPAIPHTLSLTAPVVGKP